MPLIVIVDEVWKEGDGVLILAILNLSAAFYIIDYAIFLGWLRILGVEGTMGRFLQDQF